MCVSIRTVALFPVPHPGFRRLQYGGPGTFPHVSDVKGRKGRKFNMGIVCFRTARRTKVPGNTPHVSS